MPTLNHPHHKVIVTAIEFNNKNIYVLQIGARLCYKLRQLCFITNQGKHCYKLGQLHYYKVLLQIEAAIRANDYYNIGHLLQIMAKCIKNWGRYYKVGQLLQIWAQQSPGLVSFATTNLDFLLWQVTKYETKKFKLFVDFLNVYGAFAVSFLKRMQHVSVFKI